MKKPTSKSSESVFSKFLINCSESFYNDDDKIVTDEEFDQLKDLYETTFNKRFQIGAKVKVANTVSVSHSFKNLAGTLDKVNTVSEFIEWSKTKKLGPCTSYFGSYKIDGHSLNFEYENGLLVKALTRGDEGVGKDLTDYFTKMSIANNVSMCTIPTSNELLKGKIGIGFEACVLYEDFEEMVKNEGVTYSNPRSALNGIMSEDGAYLSKYLTLVPLKIHSIDGEIDRATQLSILDTEFSYLESFKWFETNLTDITTRYDFVCENRFNLPYMIDGLVIEVNDRKLRSSLGYTDNRPNFAIALKLPYIEKETTVTKIEWFTEGNSATYTPVVWFKPVVINGNTYQKVSLANYKRFMALQLQEGSNLLFALRNDVLGYVNPLPNDGNKLGKLFEAPTECKFCNEDLFLDENEVFLTCQNNNCQLVQVGNLENFIEKTKVKGIRRNTLESLYENGLVTDIPSLFKIDYSAVSKLPKFGKSSADNIKNSLNKIKSSPIDDYQIVGSLNIPFFSVRRAKKVLKVYSLDELYSMIDDSTIIDNLCKIDSVKEAIAGSIVEGLVSNFEVISELSGILDIKDTKRVTKTNDTETVYSFCITGSLNHYNKREDLQNVLESIGHTIQSSVSKKTNYLVTNTPNSGTEKNKSAIKHGVKIITEDELIKLFNL